MTARTLHYLLASSLVVSSAFAAKNGGALFEPVNGADAQRSAASFVAPESNVALFIWGDKYVYRAGDQLTLRMTVKANDDLYPYTIVAYRQNNQNGRKFYLPAGTDAVTDLFGNAAADGFQPTRVNSADRAVLLGNGGTVGGAVTIPDELGMHTLVVELRDYTGTRVIKASYFKFGVVDEEVAVSGHIDSSRTWVNTKSYRLQGTVFVRANAVLTIEPGTFVVGAPGSQPASALIVARTGRIEAAGTKSRPIVMTSSRAFGDRQRGDWGGLVLLGAAQVNTGANSGGNTNQAGEFQIEGLPATEDSRFGGTNNAHNCGTLTYVRVEYAGAIQSPNNELNSFTFGGCGTGTTAHHLQAIYGLDDSFEWFGGTMNAKYLVGGLGADDFVDYQLGWTGKLQFGVFYQSSDSRGNRGLEGDNSEFNNSAEPWSNPTIYNTTFIGSGADGFDEPGSSAGLYVRRGARGSINNTVVANFGNQAVRIADNNTTAQLTAGNLTFNGLLIWNNSRLTSGANTVVGQFHSSATVVGDNAASRTVIANPLMRRSQEFSDPDWRGMFSSPIFRAGWVAPPDDGFFDQSAKFIGAFGDDDWTEEWTSFLIDTDLR